MTEIVSVVLQGGLEAGEEAFQQHLRLSLSWDPWECWGDSGTCLCLPHILWLSSDKDKCESRENPLEGVGFHLWGLKT